MTRHSKNQNERPFFSHSERKKVGFGLSRELIDSDSLSKFGHCCLTLKPCDNPVATSDGYIYERDALIEYLGAEKARLAALADQASATIDKRTDEHSLVPNARAEAALKTSFWVSPAAVSTKAEAPSKVDTTPKCPMSGNRIRLKDLTPIKFELSKAKDGSPIYVCSVSKRPITHQKAVLLKPSGIVVLESVYQDIIKPSGRCPVTNMLLTSDDILTLKSSGTSFSSSGNTEVKRHVDVKSRAFEGGTRGLNLT